MKVNILGINIDKIGLTETLEVIGRFIASGSRHLIVTVNPEIILEAQKNQQYRQALNSATLATCDGAGLQWAAKFLHQENIPRVTGVDLTLELLRGEVPGARIYLLGGEQSVALELQKKYPQNVVGAESGGRLVTVVETLHSTSLQNAEKQEWILENQEEIFKKIKASGANILLAAFGGVKQEIWLHDNLRQMPSVKVGIGVGGTYDYLTGRVKRPPAWMRRAGLEWLYRLIVMPSRAGRIYNATVKFPLLVLREKFKK